MPIFNLPNPTSPNTSDALTSLPIRQNFQAIQTALNALDAFNITPGTLTQNLFAPGAIFDWISRPPVPSSITYNGGGNYSAVFSGVDLTSYIFNGMKFRFTRTNAAPTQCAFLNGSTQFYNKTSPSGISFTSAYTALAWVKLAAYQDMGVIDRDSAAGTASGWGLQINSGGQIVCFARNATGTIVGTTYQSVPLNRWTHVAASLNAATGTVLIYVNGILVPSATSTAGTTIVQATTDLLIGKRNSVASFLSGKVVQVGLFSTALAQSTIQSYISQGLAGTEPNCIGAWSLSNSVADLSSNGNTLSPNGSVVATTVDSPFAGGANASTAYTAGTTEFAEVFNISYSTNTTVVFQAPDGYAIPTSGGVSAVSYSTNASPVGWPLPGGIRLVGKVLVTSQTGTSTTPSQLLGVTVSSYIPQGREVRVRLFTRYLRNGTANKSSYMGVYEGTVGSGFNITNDTIFSSASTNYGAYQAAENTYTPSSSGSKTYNAYYATDSAGTFAADHITLTVELL